MVTKKSTAPKPTAAQLSKWTEKYGRAPKRSEIAWEMELAAGAEERQAAYLAGQLAGNARAEAAMAARAAPIYTAEQLAFAKASSEAETEQAAALKAAQAAGQYAEVETAGETRAIERAADRKHEES